ncbi:hypothetical protein BJF78_27245 [Pseudonocardia sp. CNS-139]|nr:hypothetical protein BJF78_27245 [Pseudonocardia sp. CNS-139]
MQVREHVDELERQGVALVAAAEAAGPDAAVPDCPGWTVRDLVAHTAGVHAWATTFVRADPDAVRDAELPGPAPGEDVVARYRAAHAELVAALRAAPPDLQTWSFLAAPSPLAFWARRQAHEAAVHRADAEAAAGRPVGYSAAFAADGIDELLTCFLTRPGRRLRSERPLRLLVAPDDEPRRWLATIDADGCRVTVSTAEEPADHTARGPASALYLQLWNRGAPAGDNPVIALWRERARITW